MRKWMGVALVAAVGVAVGAVALWQRAPAVPAVAVSAGPLVRTLQFSARVAAPQRVELGATVTGRVAQVVVTEGAEVAAGALLLSLEDAEARAALAQAQAAERQAAARLAGLRGTGRQALGAGVAQAESVLAAAEAEARRTQSLVASGFLSPARQDESQRAVAVARAQLDAARAQSAAAGERGSELAQAESGVAAARAAVQAAAARLAQAQLRAPAAGRVIARSAEPGQIVQPGRALLTLALAGPAELRADVDERYLAQLSPGQAAAVRADAFPAQRFAATVRAIAPQVDAQRGSVEVRLAVPEPPAFLREDMTLSVEVLTARRERALAVPLAALRGPDGEAAAESTVWVAADGRVAARRVTLGLRTLDAAEVAQGLAAGDVVLLGPAPAPGARVRADLAAGAAQATGRRRGDDAAATWSQGMGR